MNAESYYRRALDLLTSFERPFLVGGAAAFYRYTGIDRDTKDIDIFVLKDDVEYLLQRFTEEGYSAELTYPHWLAKVHSESHFVDLIFSSGNGVCPVAPDWFDLAPADRVWDREVLLLPAEEMLWTKSFIMERERFDGADVAHLLKARGEKLDWPRLLRRFGDHWRVLLSHLVLFGFIYPGERERVPDWVMRDLLDRLENEAPPSPEQAGLCRGTLLSREQYLIDIEGHEGRDSRLTEESCMTRGDVRKWTDAIDDDKHGH